MKKVYDELGREIPTFKQLGITPEIESREMAKGGESFDRFYLARLEAWQLVNERKKAQRIASKSAGESVKERMHWYNSLGEEKVKALILRVVDKRDDVFELFFKKLNFKSPLHSYYFNLLDRVKPENLSIRPAPYSKLKRFPSYNFKSDKLEGSIFSFMALFVHCFPPIKRPGKTVMF